MDLIMKFTCDEAGASAIEYALLLALIGVAIISSASTFGTAIVRPFLAAAAVLPGG